MPDEVAVDRVPLVNQFPALRLFDAALAALSPGSVAIGLVASLLLSFAGANVDRGLPIDVAQGGPQTAFPMLGGKFPLMESITNPWLSVVQPAIAGFTSDAGVLVCVMGLLQSGLALTVWSLAGGILCRRSAFLIFGDERSALSKVTVHGLRRWGASVRSPLIPLAAALLIGLILVVFGLPGRLRVWGPTWLFVASPVIGCLSFVMSFLLLATMLAWPLMIAAVAIDDCESFGGLSRAYSMLTSRPWTTAGYVLLGIVASTLLLMATLAVAETTIWCGVSATAIGSGAEHSRQGLLVPLSTMVHEVVRGVGVSFFWSAAAIIYLLLRHDVDGVPLDRVAPDDDERPAREPLPVVGIPATDAKAEANEEVPSVDERAS